MRGLGEGGKEGGGRNGFRSFYWPRKLEIGGGGREGGGVVSSDSFRLWQCEFLSLSRGLKVKSFRSEREICQKNKAKRKTFSSFPPRQQFSLFDYRPRADLKLITKMVFHGRFCFGKTVR